MGIYQPRTMKTWERTLLACFSQEQNKQAGSLRSQGFSGEDP
jgi:hypothetical protein